MTTSTEAKKPGLKSTEFWLPGGALAGLQGVIGVTSVSDSVQIACAVGIGAIAVTYIVCRTVLKLRTGSAQIPGEELPMKPEGGAV